MGKNLCKLFVSEEKNKFSTGDLRKSKCACGIGNRNAFFSFISQKNAF